MKQIDSISEVKQGDYILCKIGSNNNRVYKVLVIDVNIIYDREAIYSSDGSFSNHPISKFPLNWYILNKKEANYYLKLAIFSS